jgi:hypothetical protein
METETITTRKFNRFPLAACLPAQSGGPPCQKLFPLLNPEFAQATACPGDFAEVLFLCVFRDARVAMKHLGRFWSRTFPWHYTEIAAYKNKAEVAG